MELTPEQTGNFEGVGFGVKPKPDFWLSQGDKTSPRVHVAFLADSRAAVDAFHAAALAAGGEDNGFPGLRSHYHPNYYGAFIDRFTSFETKTEAIRAGVKKARSHEADQLIIHKQNGQF